LVLGWVGLGRKEWMGQRGHDRVHACVGSICLCAIKGWWWESCVGICICIL
jgi:hypothetical protein